MSFTLAIVMPSDQSSKLLRFLSAILTPIVRAFIPKINYPAFCKLLGAVYLSEATRYLQRTYPGKRVTQSSMSLVSGIPTHRLREFQSASAESISRVDSPIEWTLMDAWYYQPDFRDPDTKKPYVLPLKGPSPSFEQLVARHAGRNVTPQTVLRSLLTSKCVEMVGGDAVRAIKPMVMSSMQMGESHFLQVFSRTMSRVGGTLVHNLECTESTDKLRQRELCSYHTPVEVIPALIAKLHDLSDESIEQEVRELIEPFEDQQRPESPGAVGLGWYVFVEEGARPQEGE